MTTHAPYPPSPCSQESETPVQFFLRASQVSEGRNQEAAVQLYLKFMRVA